MERRKEEYARKEKKEDYNENEKDEEKETVTLPRRER